jgi:hypothetical protein
LLTFRFHKCFGKLLTFRFNKYFGQLLRGREIGADSGMVQAFRLSESS